MMENLGPGLRQREANMTFKSSPQCSDDLHYFDHEISRVPNLYMPLTGKEYALRLEDKYGMLQSDEEEDESSYRKRGKVSDWKIEKSPSKWLHTQSVKCQSQKVTSEGQKNLRRKTQCRTTAKNSDGETSGKYAHLESGPSYRKEASQNEDKISDREGAKPDTCVVQWIDGQNESLSEGFSLEDTERPKFQIQPVAAKVAFQLSDSGVEPSVKVPASINQYLRDYQREGIRFLYQHYMRREGAILGDDMGLGKTVQVIGFLAAVLGKQGNHKDALQALPKFIRELSDEISCSPPRTAKNPFLIIGPSAVMFNWLDELVTWGYFSARKFHGGDKDLCLSDLNKGKLEIVVTTYETFRDNDKLLDMEWEAVIVDEVHKIKDMKAQITQALSLISTPCRYGLTGTALQNSMAELFSILNWAQPGILGSPEEFNYDYVNVIEAGQKHDATKRVLAEARKRKDKFAQIRQRVLLRRTKTLLADQLPTKEDLVVMCRMTDLQISVYKAVLTHPDMDSVLRAEDPCDCGKRKLRASCCYKFGPDGTKTWALTLSYMHLLLKAANHCALLIPANNNMAHEKQFKRAREVCEHAFKDYPQFVEQTKTAAFMTLSDPRYCGKMKILQGLLSVFAATHDKVLVFSYSTRLLDIIEHFVMSKCYTYRRIDGKTSSQKRLDIVHQFNADQDIFLCLISTKAGGLGLNLTGANRVIIFDPNWNPTHDLQAQDRAFRIGQTRNVKVYRLVSAGTIEENIYLRQIYKQQLDEVAVSSKNAKRLFHGIQGDKLNQGELFGVRNMFSLRTGNTCLTMDIIQRNDRLEKGLENYDITDYVCPRIDDNSHKNVYNEVTLEQTMDSESEESDHLFESIFGIDKTQEGKDEENVKTPLDDKAGCSEWSNFNSPSPSKHKKMDKTTTIESEDEEFSLIPTLYPRCEKTKNLYASELGHERRNDFTIEDITFSKTAWNTTPDSIDGESTGKKCAALSLIFSDRESKNLGDGNGDSDAEQKRASSEGKVLNRPVNIETGTSKKMMVLKSGPTDTLKRNHDRSKQNEGEKAVKSKRCQREAITDVFETCGVLHTHLNPQIIGSSRAEDHMSHCAMKEVFDLNKNSQDPALQCDPLPVDNSKRKAGKRKAPKKMGQDYNSVRSVKSGSTRILLGQTPPGVQRQQWMEICKFKGSDPLKLAEYLVTSSPEERLDLLHSFYSHLHNNLKDVIADLLQINIDDSSHSVIKNDSNQHVSKKKKPSTSKSVSTGKESPRTKPCKSSGCDVDSVIAKHKRGKNFLKRRQLSYGLFAESTLLSSQSQESLTAFSPPREPPSSEDCDSEGFSSSTSSKGKMRSFKTKSPVSKSITRLRHRTANEMARRKLFCKSQYKRLLYTYSNKDEDNKTAPVSMATMPMQLEIEKSAAEPEKDREDISTLLIEMAEGESAQIVDRDNRCEKYKCKTAKQQKSGGFLPDHKTQHFLSSEHDSKAQSQATVEIATCIVAQTNSSRQEKTHSLKQKTKDPDSQKKQNYASLLDDIFCLTSSKDKVNSETVLIAESSLHVLKNSSDKQKSVKTKASCSKSPFKAFPWDGDKSSYDLPLVPNISNCLSDNVEDLSKEVEDSQDLSIFDSLFKMSTLREESDIDKKAKSQRKSIAKFSWNSKNKDTAVTNEDYEAAGDESQSLFS